MTTSTALADRHRRATTEARDLFRQVRHLAAELKVLEAYDELRSAAGHDYGGGQRYSELVRRRRELERVQARYEAVAGARVDVGGFTGPALREAFDRVGRPRKQRLERDTYTLERSRSSQKSLKAWERTERLYAAPAPADAVEHVV